MNAVKISAGFLSVLLFVQSGLSEEPAKKSTKKTSASAKRPAPPSASAKKTEADKKPAEKKENGFLRIKRDESGTPVAMETSIVSYVPKSGSPEELKVDLISAVHIGDKKYYDALNEAFKKYDVLLYELVAPPGTKIQKADVGKRTNAVSSMQMMMKNVLKLEWQLECVDYQPKNFVHADMSPEDFSNSMAKRGESMWAILLKAIGQGMAQQNKPGATNDVALLMAFMNKDQALSMKRVFAEQFEDMEGAMTIFSGPDGSTIITERNKVALKVLKEQIHSGKKKLGVFYGGGHLPDMEERLISDFDLIKKETRWLVAWDMPEKKNDPASKVPARKAAPQKVPAPKSPNSVPKKSADK